MTLTSILFSYLEKQAEKSELECRRAELSLFEKNPDATILDVGCADGKFTLKAANVIGTGKINGIEIVAKDIEKAKAIGINVIQSNLNEKIPFGNDIFDVIIASHVIEHLSDTDTIIKEIYRTLKIGGYLVIATPNLAAFIHIIFLLIGKQPTIAEVSDSALVGTWSPRGKCINREGPAHRRIFTLAALKELLEYHGLTVEKAIGSGFHPLPDFLAKIIYPIDKRHTTNIIVKARKSNKQSGK